MELLPLEEFEKIRTRVDQIVASQNSVKNMNKAMADMFWIAETDAGAGNSNLSVKYNAEAWGDDIRLTASTNSRDQITGLHRLLKSTKPKFSITCKDKGYANKIEKALDKWWLASNERLRFTNESELSFSGALWADMNLSVTKVDDMITQLEQGDDKVKRVLVKRLKRLRKKTPFLFETESALDAYPVWGRNGKSEHLTQTTMKGIEIKENWGIMDVQDDHGYTVNDYWNLVYRCVYFDEKQIIGGEHGLPDIPRFTSVTDGTELFHEENKKRNPFLYGKWKSNIHKREDELLTVMASSVFNRGGGPLVLRNKSEPGYQDDAVDVTYEGLVRIMSMHGKPQLVDDKAFDGVLFQLHSVYGQMGESTAISGQALGEAIEKYTAYSGYLAAQKGGRLPLIDIEEAEKKVIHDAAIYALELFKDDNIEWEGLKPDEILDDVEIEVKLTVDLPQDKVQAAQALAQLSNLNVPISTEWIHNELQIRDSKKMVNDWMSERAEVAAFNMDMQNLVPQLLQMLQVPPAQPPGGMPPGGTPEGMPPGVPPEGPVNTARPEMVGGPNAGGAVLPGNQPIPEEDLGGRPPAAG